MHLHVQFASYIYVNVNQFYKLYQFRTWYEVIFIIG